MRTIVLAAVLLGCKDPPPIAPPPAPAIAVDEKILECCVNRIEDISIMHYGVGDEPFLRNDGVIVWEPAAELLLGDEPNETRHLVRLHDRIAIGKYMYECVELVPDPPTPPGLGPHDVEKGSHGYLVLRRYMATMREREAPLEGLE